MNGYPLVPFGQQNLQSQREPFHTRTRGQENQTAICTLDQSRGGGSDAVRVVTSRRQPGIRFWRGYLEPMRFAEVRMGNSTAAGPTEQSLYRIDRPRRCRDADTLQAALRS